MQKGILLGALILAIMISFSLAGCMTHGTIVEPPTAPDSYDAPGSSPSDWRSNQPSSRDIQTFPPTKEKKDV